MTIYSATWCAFCHAAKRYLDERKVPYTDLDVEKDRDAAMDSVRKSGQMGIPVIDIGGTIVIGFDRPRIDDALQKHGLA